jgi:hypothetical protein
MTKHEVILCLRISTKCSCRNLVKFYKRRNLVKFYKRNLTYKRLHVNKGKNGISMAITHEQGVLTSFLGLVRIELIFIKFP